MSGPKTDVHIDDRSRGPISMCNRIQLLLPFYVSKIYRFIYMYVYQDSYDLFPEKYTSIYILFGVKIAILANKLRVQIWRLENEKLQSS